MYMVTPRGVARRARLTYEFMRYSLDFYHDVRRHLRDRLAGAVAAHKRVAIYGTGDAAELVYLLLKSMGADPVAVFDGTSGERFLGFTILDVSEHARVEFDVLVMAVLERPAAARKRLLAAGIPAAKLLMLHPQQLAPRAETATDATA
jgi:hypothetical protein